MISSQYRILVKFLEIIINEPAFGMNVSKELIGGLLSDGSRTSEISR